MDYFIVFLLLTIIFTFMSDKKVNSIQEIEAKNESITSKIDEVFNNIIVIDINENINSKEEMKEIYNTLITNDNNQCIMLKRNGINLTNESIRIIIANYINTDRKACGFMPSYSYKYINHKTFNDIKHELKIAAINYINIFAKEDINSYGIIILDKEQLEKFTNGDNSYEIITFSPCECVEVVWNDDKNNKFIEEVKEIYDADIKAIVKSGLIIAVGVTVTANVISAIYNFNLINIIVSGIMYWCYSFVLKYMYSPIGQYKVVAKYLFPIFLICYLIILFIGGIIKHSKIKSSNKKAHVS